MNYLTILFAFCISLIYVMKIESSDMMHMTSGHGGGIPMVLIKQDGHSHRHKSDLFMIGGSDKCPPFIMKNSGKGKHKKKLIFIPGDCKHKEEKKQEFIPYPVTVKEYIPVPMKQMHPIMMHDMHDMHDNGMMGHSMDMGMHDMMNGMHGMDRKK